MSDLILLYTVTTSAIIWIMLLLVPVRWRMSERWEIFSTLRSMNSPWPTLSVIIPARNESASLPVTLPSWLEAVPLHNYITRGWHWLERYLDWSFCLWCLLAGLHAFITAKPVIIVSSSISLLSMSLSYLPTIRFFNVSVWRMFSLPVAAALYLSMTIFSAMNYLSGWLNGGAPTLKLFVKIKWLIEKQFCSQ